MRVPAELERTGYLWYNPGASEVIRLHTAIYPIPGCPVRIALLSDMHGRPFAKALARAAACRPDLIAVPGDVLNRHSLDYARSPLDTQENALLFLRACTALAPTFFSPGNHEWMLDEEDLDRLRQTGVTVLDNEYRSVEICGQRLAIGGLSSASYTDHRRRGRAAPEGKRYSEQTGGSGLHGLFDAAPPKPDTAWLEDFAAAPGYHVLLCHHPEYFPRIPDGVELILSGHAHGGQWAYWSFRIKRMCGVLAPGQGFFPKWTKGVYENRLVVSTGLSNTALPIPRFFNPTEVVVVEGTRRKAIGGGGRE